MATETPTRDLATLTDADRIEMGKVVHSMVIRGDISALSPEDRTKYVVKLCERLRLDPMTQPLAIIRLNGKDVCYPTKGATDQLASVWGVDRELVERPHIVDTGAGKVLMAVCKATWRGRSDVSTGAVPVPSGGGEALCNALLKVETKAKRRATLSILGLGMLDETEIESIPASAKGPSEINLDQERDRVSTVLAKVRDQLDHVVGLASAAGVFVDHLEEMQACGIESRAHDKVQYLLVGHLEATGHTGVKSKIAGAIRAEEAKRARQLPTVSSTIAEAVQSVAPAVESVGLVPKAYDAELSALAPVTVEGVAAIWVRHRHAIERLEKGVRGLAWKWAVEAAAIAGGTKESLTAAVLALTEPQPEPTPPKGTKRGHGPVSNETTASATVEHTAQSDAVSAQRVELDGWVIQQAYDRDFCGADDRKAWQQYCRTKRLDFALMGSLLKRREAFSRRGLWADRYESVVWELGSRMPGGIVAAQKALDTWMAGPSKKAVAA